MQQFEENIINLIHEIDPRNINLSNDIYVFRKIVNENISQLPFSLRVGQIKKSSLTFPANVPFKTLQIYFYTSLSFFFLSPENI